MKPIYFDLDDGLSLTILPENNEEDGTQTCTFQMYAGSSARDKGLNDLNNYSGMISLDQNSQEFYYTPGNLALSCEEILQLIEHIKSKIY